MASAAKGRGYTPKPGKAEEGVALPVRHRGLLTVGIMAATLMQVLDTTIANVALPHMQAALGATTDTITWILTSYLIASAIAIPITGWLADRIGSRNLFLLAVTGFIVASMACGMAMNLEEMVLFRCLQGASAAFIPPLAQTALLDINPPRKHSQALALWASGVMVGPILGPLIGGWLTENYNWRWIFYINLPICALCLTSLWFLLPSRPKQRRKFDMFGFALLALGIGALQLALDRGQGEDWLNSPEIIVELMIAAICLWMWGVHMFTAKNPMFDTSLWKDRNLVTGLIFIAMVGVVTTATLALLPPMLQNLYGYSVFQSGLLMTPRGIGVVSTMYLASYCVDQRGVDARFFVGGGLAISALSLFHMSQWNLNTGGDAIFITGLMQGMGMGMVFMPLNTMAFATLPMRVRTEGSSLLNLSRSVGGAIGISLVSTMLARGIQTSHANVGSYVTPERLDMMDPRLLQGFGDTAQMVAAMIDAEVNRQAVLIAYLNDFIAMAAVTGITVFLVIFMKPAKRQIGGGPPDASAMAH